MMRIAKLLTFYVLPLIALSIYFLPSELPHTDDSAQRRSVAQAMVDHYDQNLDGLLESLEFPVACFYKIDCNEDYFVTEREITYYMNVGSKDLIGDYTYYEAMPRLRASNDDRYDNYASTGQLVRW